MRSRLSRRNRRRRAKDSRRRAWPVGIGVLRAMRGARLVAMDGGSIEGTMALSNDVTAAAMSAALTKVQAR
ncbi:MAG: hypothetical protein RL689_1403 [Planctomycetota bacterium]